MASVTRQYGTYTPTLTAVANVTSTQAFSCQWSRCGNTITVSGRFDVNPTANNTATSLGISLPLASRIANNYELAGAGHSIDNSINAHGVALYGDATNDRAEAAYYETHGASESLVFIFMYQIL